MLKRLGIAEQVNAKSVIVNAGSPARLPIRLARR